MSGDDLFSWNGGGKPETPDEKVCRRVKERLESLDRQSMKPDARAVLELIEWSMIDGAKMTQIDIAKTERWLGCHPEHEKDIVRNEFASTTRQVRELIRTLRLQYRVPILSDRLGYFLPTTKKQVDEYIDRTAGEAKARAESSLETYRVMKAELGGSNPFLDGLDEK